MAYYPDEVIEQIGGGHTILSWCALSFRLDNSRGYRGILLIQTLVGTRPSLQHQLSRMRIAGIKLPISLFRVLKFDDLLAGRCTEMTQVQEKSLCSVLLTMTCRPNA